MYEIGTISTKANDPKITGKNTLWKNSVTKVSVGQIILIQSGNTIYQNSIRSVESDTQMTLSFPVPVALTDVKYVISITMIGSVSDGVNKATAMVTESYQLMMILNRLMTESGVIKVVLPDGTEMQLRTAKEMDKLLDGKFDKAGGTISGDVTFSKNAIKSTKGTHTLPAASGTLMQVGDYGVGDAAGFYPVAAFEPENPFGGTGATKLMTSPNSTSYQASIYWTQGGKFRLAGVTTSVSGEKGAVAEFYSTANTTKDSNGNLKAASPIVKVFTDHIETNDESEGVEMEHLGVGHYLIKGVVGFNADGAWGINNGFVIPQDHNGKNMVLIDCEVRPDGDIEVFVFHQQNADMPERFQNKRIKHIDEDGNPVYYENYEPCDVPESRWIDMRVEMPVNSIYNQKQAEAQRLAKLEAERLAQEEAKRAAEEEERVEQGNY
ncbi:hypothetical protein HBA43_21250 [Providencia rettgeri]|nr:hypothetical protein [Providencia rettgeri]NIA80906.1 hypothetical protein [Providencia rettgeri]NIB04148.1 hypothetical protein [Providencia rettgeri]NIB08353.1 hypothetical protein [Providencia rettgeri]NIB21958.1 hypothetical protein [Providencia rettgeri]